MGTSQMERHSFQEKQKILPPGYEWKGEGNFHPIMLCGAKSSPHKLKKGPSTGCKDHHVSYC